MTLHSRSRVVVIGAGPEGLHMAGCLRRRGYRCVRVIEARGQCGGVDSSISPAEVWESLGEPVDDGPLVDRIISPAPQAGVGRHELLGHFERRDFAPIARWLRGVGAAEGAVEPTLVERAHVVDAAIRYHRLYTQLLGPREEAFALEPHEARLHWIDCSMLELLMQHRLQALVPLLTLIQALAGYGPLAQVPAYYGLLANRPAVLWRWLRASPEAEPWPAIAWPERHRGRWDALVRLLDLDVQRGAQLIGVSRPRVGPHRLQIKSREGWSRTIEADAVVVSIPVPQFVRLLHRPTVAEVELSGLMDCARLRMTRIASPDRPFRRLPWAGLIARIGGPMKGEVQALRRVSSGGRSALDEWVVSQVDWSGRRDDRQLERCLAHDLELVGFERHEVLEWTDHRCHGRFTAAGIQQLGPWRLQREQGTLRTFYVGSAGAFGGIEAIARHNRQLCEQWFPGLRDAGAESSPRAIMGARM